MLSDPGERGRWNRPGDEIVVERLLGGETRFRLGEHYLEVEPARDYADALITVGGRVADALPPREEPR